MKILLIQPKFNTHLITPPLGIGYLASALMQDENEVKLLDCVAHDIDVHQEIKDFLPDFIGITVLSASYTAVIKLIKNIRYYGCNSIIVIGGSHVSALPEQSLKDTKADYCIIGEGEITFTELVKKYNNPDKSEIKGIAYFLNNNVIINKPRELIENIDTIKFPAWDIIKPDKYPPTPHGAFYKEFPIAPITTTRGCPYNCIFCASKCTWRQKLRIRSPENVVDEIEYLHTKFGIKEFHFEDDNFTFSKEHVMNVCKNIIERNLKVVWACPNGVRIDKIDKEIIQIMKQAGCYQLSFGIESGNQKILNGINKHLNLKIVPEIIKLVKNEGITTCGFFILGLPEDTKETIEDTINFAVSIPFDRVQFSRFMPLPGTEPFDKWYKESNNFDWNMINLTGETTYRIPNLSSKEIASLQQQAFRKFYLRPKIIIKTLSDMKLNQYLWFLKRIGDYKIW